jgi:DNA-binding GntR family transcriptional regulator
MPRRQPSPSPAAPAKEVARPKLQAVPDGGVEQRIYDSVFDSVMSQRLPPGTKLPEAALCELFDVTRNVVRKVLQRLAHDHIVDLRPNKGAVVASPTPEETRQIFEARRGLEAVIVRLAAQNAQPADVQDLRERMAREHEAMHRFDQPAWSRLASSFHLRVAQLARNPILERYLVELLSRCSLIVALYEAPGNASCEHEEHEALVDCIALGDGDGAARLMDQHLMALERNIELRQSGAEPSLGRMLGLQQ